MHRKFVFILITLFLAVVLFSTFVALSAANAVPQSGLSDSLQAVSISELAPPECASISNNLESIVVCTGGTCNGSNANELMLGTSGSDSIDGKNGDDCIVGGDGDDTLMGDNDNDILVGGPGVDTLDGGQRPKDTDICVDDSGSTTFVDCEVIH